jgi:hypothetical protein
MYICSVIGGEGREELGLVVSDLFVCLRVLVLPSAGTSQKGSLVQLHTRGNGDLASKISPVDVAEDGRSAAKELGRGHQRRLLV